jgi:hypothetical protein
LESRRSHLHSKLSDPPSAAGAESVPACVREFRGLRDFRVLGNGPRRVARLFGDPPAHVLITIKLFDPEASDGASLFFGEIDALVLLVHPRAVRIVGHWLATLKSPGPIGTEFAGVGYREGGCSCQSCRWDEGLPLAGSDSSKSEAGQHHAGPSEEWQPREQRLL